jgi:sugar (pentulose or hexulose) kinase
VITLGVDIGTTTITALAWDGERVVASETVANDGGEDADRMIARALDALHAVAGRPVAAIGATGQQHGVVLVDPALRPLGPFVNWQDRRGARDAASRPGTWGRRSSGFSAGGSSRRPARPPASSRICSSRASPAAAP